jgi:hypothetical protein
MIGCDNKRFGNQNTFTATGDTGLTATATTTATVSVAPPPPPPPNPTIVARFGPSNDIDVGTVAQFQVETTNATDASIACTGLWPASGPISTNVGWGGDLITYNNPGSTNCTAKAQNSAGVIVTASVTLNVHGYDADGNRLAVNCATSTCGAASAPSLPAATGSSATGNIGGYVGPDGQLYSDPAGTQLCNSKCTSDGTPTNVGNTPETVAAPTGDDVNSTGTDDTTTSSSTSNSY